MVNLWFRHFSITFGFLPCSVPPFLLFNPVVGCSRTSKKFQTEQTKRQIKSLGPPLPRLRFIDTLLRFRGAVDCLLHLRL